MAVRDKPAQVPRNVELEVAKGKEQTSESRPNDVMVDVKNDSPSYLLAAPGASGLS
ncbi:MAG: hypothetical protein Q9224_000195 [Gallowayella concinna]